MQKCKRCYKPKPLNTYFRHHLTANGRNPICPDCMSKAYRKGKRRQKKREGHDLVLANQALQKMHAGPDPRSVREGVMRLVDSLRLGGIHLEAVAVDGRACHVRYAVQETYELQEKR